MKVEVLLFGRPRELAGTSKKIVSIREGGRLADLFQALGSRYGEGVSNELRRTEALIVMINGRHYATLGGLDAPLSDKDTVAIMPAVVGG